MKPINLITCLVALIAISGCAGHGPVVLHEVVGPAPQHPNESHTGTGQLVVYSARDLMNTADSDHPAHTSYIIYDHDGDFRQRVNNRAGSFYQEPASVSLPVGSYEIEAKASNGPEVLIPVLIAESRSTIVDLEGSNLSRNDSKSGDQWVRLPGGQIIGSRAN